MKWRFFLIFLIASALNADNIKNQEEDLFNKDISSFFINGEFLYWTVFEGSLDYALSMKNSAWGPDNVYASGDYKRAKFDWDPGFRISLGYFNAPKYYNVFLEYERVVIDGSNSSYKPSETDQFLTGTFPQIMPALSKARSHIKMNYDLINLLVSRIFITNPHLRLSLFGGLTTSIIKQKWNVKYFNSLENMTEIKNKWRYLAGGLRLGLAADWFWGNDFYLTMKSSSALYIGRYKNDSFGKTDYLIDVEYDTDVPFKDSRYKHYRPSFSFQFLLGPSWQKSFSTNRVEVFAGYEINGWFNLHEVYRSSSGVPAINKDTFINKAFLALNGLTTRLSVNF